MAVKLVIFDLDGTIVNAYPAIIESVNFTLAQFGLGRRGDLAIKRAVGWGDKNLLKPFVPGPILDKAVKTYRNSHQGSLIRKSKLIAYAENLLLSLKKKHIKLAVASNRPTKFSLILLNHLKIKKYFDYILCADKLKYGKPHPDILNRIVKTIGVNKHNALYVGDMAIDAEAGRRAKIKTIIVLGGSSSRGQIKKEKPYKIAKNLSGVLRIIQKENEAGING